MSLKNFRSNETPSSGEQPPKVYTWDYRSSAELPADLLEEGEQPPVLEKSVFTPTTLLEWARFYATSTGTDPNDLVKMTNEDIIELAGNGAYGEGNWAVVRDATPSQPVLGWQGKPEQSQQLLNVVYRPKAEQS